MASVIYLDKKGRKEPIFTLTKGDAKTKNVRFMLPADDGETAIDSLIWMISIHNAGGKDDATKLQKIHHEDHIHLNWQCGWVAAAEEGITTIQIIGYNEDGDRQWSSGEYCILVNPLEDTQIPKEDITELQELIADAAEAMETATQETIEATKRADEAADNAAQAATEAAETAEAADNAAGAANTAAQAATEAAEAADNAAQAATEAAQAATEAAQAATEAAEAANTAAEAADNARLAIADELNKKAPVIPVDASGDIVTITDGAEGMPVQSLITHVEPVQEGSGAPSPDNVRPISGWDAVSVTGTGKNLFGGETLADRFQSVMTVKRDDEERTISFRAANASGKVFFTDFKPDTRYTIILYGRNGSVQTNTYISYTDGTTGKPLFVESATDCYAVYTTEAGKSVEAFMGSYSSGTTVLYYDMCGIFEGVLTEADFAEYQGKTLTAALPETLYGFDKNWTTGLVTVRQIKQKIKDFNWEAYTSVAGGYRYEASVTNKAVGAKGLLCDTLPVISYSVENKAETLSERTGQIKTTRIITAYATKAEMLAAYGEAEVVYYLAEPYTIQLTPQQLSTLKGTNNIWSNAGQTVVTYAADTKMYIDQKIAAIAAAIVNG